MGTALASAIPETQPVSSCRHCGGRIVQADGGRWWHAVAGVGPYLQCGLDADHHNLLAEPAPPAAHRPAIRTDDRAVLIQRLVDLADGSVDALHADLFISEVLASAVVEGR